MIEDLARFCVERTAKVGLQRADRGLLHATLDLYREVHRKDGETEDVADFRLMRSDPLFADLYTASTEPSFGLETTP